MKRIILALALSLSLGACAQLKTIETAVQLGTASVANPVTKDRLYQMENAVVVVFSGLNAWKKACVSGAIPVVCKQQIRTVQIYTMQIKPYLADLRKFVKTNDQVNATVVFNQLTDVIALVKGKAADAGQNVGS